MTSSTKQRDNVGPTAIRCYVVSPSANTGPFFIFLFTNIDCWYSLGLPCWGGSHKFPGSRNMKNIRIFIYFFFFFFFFYISLVNFNVKARITLPVIKHKVQKAYQSICQVSSKTHITSNWMIWWAIFSSSN